MPGPSFSVSVRSTTRNKAISDFWHSFLLLLVAKFSNTFQFSLAGDICGGHCCDNKTETDVLRKSIKTFEGLIKHQLKSLKGLWESTYTIYKGKAGASICVHFKISGNNLNGIRYFCFYGTSRVGGGRVINKQMHWMKLKGFARCFNKLLLCRLSVPGFTSSLSRKLRALR